MKYIYNFETTEELNQNLSLVLSDDNALVFNKETSTITLTSKAEGVTIDTNLWRVKNTQDMEGYTLYESLNIRLDRTTARIRIFFSGFTEFEFKFMSDSGRDTNYDYVAVGKLNLDLSSRTVYVGVDVTNNTGEFEYHSRGLDKLWITANYTNLDAFEKYFVDVFYRKDSTSSYGLDLGFVAINNKYYL